MKRLDVAHALVDAGAKLDVTDKVSWLHAVMQVCSMFDCVAVVYRRRETKFCTTC